MTDLTAIATDVQSMLETVDGFQLVEHSSAKLAPQYVPAAVHYFAGAGESDNAAIDQVLSWGVNLYAPVMDATEGNQHALELIEAVGAAVDAWAPTIDGRCLPAVLAEAKVVEVSDTLLTYYLDLRLSVPAAGTANTATGDSLLNAIAAELGDHDPVARLVADVPPLIVYDPQDLTTMYQDAAGTLPVYRPGTGLIDQPVGLMLDKSQGLELGPELWDGQLEIYNGTGLQVGAYNQSTGELSVTSVGVVNYNPRFLGPVLKNKQFYQVSVRFSGNTSKLNGIFLTKERVSTLFAYGGIAGATIVANGNEYTYIGGSFSTYVTDTPQFSIAVDGSSVWDGLFIEEISIREIKGYHAYQTTTLARPTLSGRYNLLTATETLSTQSVATEAADYTLRFEGTGTITFSGTATGTYTAGTHTITCTAGSLTLTVAGSVKRADLRRAVTSWQALPSYQRVDSATTYDTADFPLYLRSDKVDDQFALTIPAGGVAGSLLVSGADGATIEDVALAAGTYLYPPDPTTGPDNIRQWALFSRPLTDAERAAVELWAEYGVEIGANIYLAPESGYRPACVGLPSLGIRPAGVTREEISGCSYDVRYQVELIAHVLATGSTSAATVLNAASAVLIGNLLGLAGVGACRPLDDGAPGLVRDEYGRWLVRASRTIEYTISERY